MIGNFTNAHFENVEYYQVGQPILAMYPVHFHMVGDVDALGIFSFIYSISIFFNL